MKQRIEVLIIEDSPDDLFLMREVLESSTEVEANIIHRERLEDGLQAAGNTAIDVVILDLDLPDSFGLDTFVSFHEEQPLLPVIIMTGATDHDMALAAVQKGAQDYLFKGELSGGSIVRSIRYAIERQRLLTELKTALEHVKQLQGLLPICSICKNIRDDKGYWKRIEMYISEHSEVAFSHSICPECAKKHYPDFL